MAFYRVLIYTIVTAGYTYQNGLICDEYLKYPTTTLVTMVSVLPVTIPPRVVIRVSGPGVSPIEGYLVKDHFRKINDTTRIAGDIRKGYRNYRDLRSGKFFAIQKFVSEMYYYLMIGPREEIKFDKESLYSRNRNLYSFIMLTNVLGMSASALSPLAPQVFMTSYHGDMEGVKKTPLTIPGQGSNIVTLSYSVQITNLAQPPYDTNCKNYSQVGFTSSDHCLSQCLNEFLQRRELVLMSSVISNDKYQNSSLQFAPMYLRHLIDNGNQVTAKHIKNKLEKRYFLLYTKSNMTIPGNLCKFKNNLVDMFPSYKNHWMSCKKICGQADCHEESVVPQLLSNEQGERRDIKRPILRMDIFPPRDQIVTVTSTPKVSFLDFIVYTLSCLSFWYGFCPLTAADNVSGKLIYRKMIDITHKIGNVSRNIHVTFASRVKNRKRNQRLRPLKVTTSNPQISQEDIH